MPKHRASALKIESEDIGGLKRPNQYQCVKCYTRRKGASRTQRRVTDHRFQRVKYILGQKVHRALEAGKRLLDNQSLQPQLIAVGGGANTRCFNSDIK